MKQRLLRNVRPPITPNLWKRSFFLLAAICCVWPLALSAAEVATPAVTITSPAAIKLMNLEVGQPRLYDSKPLRVIEKVAGNLKGWQFTAIPQRLVMSYSIHVNKDGIIYAFGGGSTKQPPTREQFLGDDVSKWEVQSGAIAGANIPMCFRRKVTAGETISLHSFELSLAAESIVLADASSSPLAASGASATNINQSPSEVLSKEAPNVIEWALAPLDRTVPEGIRQNLIVLREDLLDEQAKAPAASAATYKLGQELCNKLVETLNERDQARVRAGYTAAQAKANMGEITNQALEARRTAAVPSGRRTSGSMAWPTYFREVDQREELRKQKQNGAALENQRPILEWADRGVQIRKALDAVYAQYREAARRPPAAK